MQKVTQNRKNRKILVKRCHVCNHVTFSEVEPHRCSSCNKGFLPLNYFSKVHAKNSQEFLELFEESHKLHEDDLIKGIHSLW